MAGFLIDSFIEEGWKYEKGVLSKDDSSIVIGDRLCVFLGEVNILELAIPKGRIDIFRTKKKVNKEIAFWKKTGMI